MVFHRTSAASVAVLALAIGPAAAQPAPIATYNTDVSQYWHLNGAALKDRLPPLDAKGEVAHDLRAYAPR